MEIDRVVAAAGESLGLSADDGVARGDQCDPFCTAGGLSAALAAEGFTAALDGAPSVLAAIRHAFPSLRHVFANGAYAGRKLEQTPKRIGRWTLEIVKRSDAPRRMPIS